ncbi:MAG: hypothetical protein PHQ40_16445 [Anaerolineaceae bacterium]|nr:hypothetical protein [Anaerolineaceae bacterium]
MSKTKIVRRPNRLEGPLTPDEELRLKAHTDLWIARILRTDPIEPDKIIPAIYRLYEVAGLKRPQVVIVPSPMVMAFAGGASAWIWYCRKHGLSPTTETATRATVETATRAATDAATWAATWAATDAATRDATQGAANGVTSALVGSAGLDCAKRFTEVYQGGNLWGHYDSVLTAFRDVLGLRLPEYEKYEAWEACAIHGGFRWMHEEFCIVSDFPVHIKQDASHRPHCDDGPSHLWRDGWSLWYIHGVAVTEQIVMHPEALTVAQIQEEQNAEVRRVMLDRFGIQRFMRESGAKTVCEYPESHPLKGLRTARLLRMDLPDDEPILMLDMLNSTPEPDGASKRYMIRIDPNAYGGRAAEDCLAAMASTYRLPDGSLAIATPEEYKPTQET